MILVTGGSGFIGSNFVKLLLEKTTKEILVVDCLTYASVLGFKFIKDLPVAFEKVNIADLAALETVFEKYNISDIFNFAAESHVDNSIKNCYPFIDTNILGVANLLNLSVKYKIKKFIQISSDEVFGSVLNGQFNEDSPILPNNPYSASKASAEHLVRSYIKTHNLPAIIINCSNNYGPNQFPEKLIPLTITKLLKGQKVPVHGTGEEIRDWLFVEDCCNAIFEVFQKGVLGERYCLGGENEITNLNLIKLIIQKMNLPGNSFEFVANRPGNDFRYSNNIKKIKTTVGWYPKWTLTKGLDVTIERIIKDDVRI